MCVCYWELWLKYISQNLPLLSVRGMTVPQPCSWCSLPAVDVASLLFLKHSLYIDATAGTGLLNGKWHVMSPYGTTCYSRWLLWFLPVRIPVGTSATTKDLHRYPQSFELLLFIYGDGVKSSILLRMVFSGMLRRVALVRTDVSEEPGASFIRVTRIGELGTTQAATSGRRTLRRNTKCPKYTYNLGHYLTYCTVIGW
jgi:hypothetical protein